MPLFDTILKLIALLVGLIFLATVTVMAIVVCGELWDQAAENKRRHL